MIPRHLALLLLPLCSLAAPANAAGLGVFADGMAELMAQSASSLREDRRYDATKALNRARELGRFLAHAPDIQRLQIVALRECYDDVRRARHELQMGRPETAAKILQAGAERLHGLQRDRLAMIPAPAMAAPLQEALGRPVMNARGETLGQVSGFRAMPGGGWQVEVAQSGLLGGVLGGLISTGETAGYPLNLAYMGRRHVALAVFSPPP